MDVLAFAVLGRFCGAPQLVLPGLRGRRWRWSVTGLGRVWQWSWDVFGVHLRLSAVFLEKCQGFGKSLGLVRCGVLCFLFLMIFIFLSLLKST